MSLVVFACVFGGALAGMGLRAVLPEHHRSTESKDIVKLGMGLIGAMAALVLGLLVASAKESYDTQKNELTALSSKVLFLDRALAHYGPETKEIRVALRGLVAGAVDQIWAKDPSLPSGLEPKAQAGIVYDGIRELLPKNDVQRSIQAEASKIAVEIAQTRSLMFEQRSSAISMPFLIVVVFWLTINFVSFGLFAPSNATVIGTLFVCALSVAGAIFLILEMDRPFDGLIQIPRSTLSDLLSQIGQ